MQCEVRGDGDEGGNRSDGGPGQQQERILQHQDAPQAGAAEPAGAPGRQLAAALDGVAQQHQGQPDGSQQQPEAPQGLEGRKVGVLDRPEARQQGRGGRRLETVRLQPPFEEGGGPGRLLLSRLDEKMAVAGGAREVALELLLRYQDFALEDAALEQP